MVLRIFVAARIKLFWSLAVQVLIGLYRLPEEGSLIRLYAGCDGSLNIVPACFLRQDLYRPMREGRLVPMMQYDNT